jgi:hypothetical protein
MNQQPDASSSGSAGWGNNIPRYPLINFSNMFGGDPMGSSSGIVEL